MGPPVLIPGSHKCTEIHPRLEVDGRGLVYDGVSGKPAGTAIAVQEMYLKAGDVLLFTDAITHGSAERTNPGYRRTIVYRYSPRYVRERFNYQISQELLQRLTPERRTIIDAQRAAATAIRITFQGLLISKPPLHTPSAPRAADPSPPPP